ncbi:MAG: TIGR03087 family PEP-CTERM/XrtA system glycosyltransferase [Thermodesulfovibrionia bacterium]|nr:TIGR03087 family PEP-CTERM/XrtA system glycosyltransferase [Thermodesulfovibrionia bacterium]
MNILFICHRIPYPPNKGDKIRSFNEVKYLSRNHDISLAFLIDNKNDMQFIDELEKYCRTIDYDVINPKWQKVKSLPYLLSEKPLTVPYFYSKKLQNAIDKRLSTTEFDVIFVFSSPMAEYVLKSKVKTGKRMRLIMDFVDVDSDKWRMYAEHSHFPGSFLYRKEWKSLMKYEKEVGELFDLSLFVSDNEVALYKSFAPDVKTVSIPNGVDFDYFSVGKPGSGEWHGKNVLLFTGAMDYFPNEDAVLYFSREIWPDVREKLPDSIFYVVGGKPSKRLRALSENNSGIVVTGYVPDVREYFQKADLFVAPLRIARGLQNKVLEAMAAGIPVVARPEAVQGLSSPNGCVLISKSESEFVNSIIEILNDSEKRKKQIHNAGEYIHKYHNWHKNLDCLKTVI